MKLTPRNLRVVYDLCHPQHLRMCEWQHHCLLSRCLGQVASKRAGVTNRPLLHLQQSDSKQDPSIS